MGMYDNVNYEDECPQCGEKMDGFQTKDGPCGLYNLEFWEVNNFYCSCAKCNTWVEYTLKKPRPNRAINIKDYSKDIKIHADEEAEEIPYD